MVQTSTTKTARLKGRVPEHQKVRVKPDCIKDALKRVRKKGWNYQRLAHKADVHRATLYRMNGAGWCDRTNVVRIAETLELPLTDFLFEASAERDARHRRRLARWHVPMSRIDTRDLAIWLIEADEIDGVVARDAALTIAPEVSGIVSDLRNACLTWHNENRRKGLASRPDEDAIDTWRVGIIEQGVHRLEALGIELRGGRWCRHVEGDQGFVSQHRVLSLVLDVPESEQELVIDRSDEPLERPIEHEILEDDPNRPWALASWRWDQASRVLNEETEA
jgi:lambda repressor-like predicted transcriptional regulator